MATKSLKPRIFAWSYSRLEVYETCPAKAKYKFVDKLQEPGGPAMDRGNALHKGLEDYIRGTARVVPKEVKASAPVLLPYYQTLRTSVKPKTEWELAVTATWEQTGWFEKDAWLRIKLDVVYVNGNVLQIDDHKSGKVYAEKHAEQCELYAVGVMPIFPGTSRVDARMLYLDQGVFGPTHSFDNTKVEMKRLQKKWEKRAKPMLNDSTFKATPGRQCGWCHFSERKGGPCRAG